MRKGWIIDHSSTATYFRLLWPLLRTWLPWRSIMDRPAQRSVTHTHTRYWANTPVCGVTNSKQNQRQPLSGKHTHISMHTHTHTHTHTLSLHLVLGRAPVSG